MSNWKAGLPTSSFMSLQQTFKREGYIVAAKGAHRPGYAASGKPQYVAVKEGQGHDKLVRNLFDPMTNIGHHYNRPHKVVVPPSMVTKQLLAAQKAAMPPPATPAGRIKETAQTAGTADTDLDLPSSTVPFDTPSRPQSDQQRAKKRSRESGDDRDDSPKRHSPEYSNVQRLASLNTPYMLDLGAISPAPTHSQGSDGAI